MNSWLYKINLLESLCLRVFVAKTLLPCSLAVLARNKFVNSWLTPTKHDQLPPWGIEGAALYRNQVIILLPYLHQNKLIMQQMFFLHHHLQICNFLPVDAHTAVLQHFTCCTFTFKNSIFC